MTPDLYNVYEIIIEGDKGNTPGGVQAALNVGIHPSGKGIRRQFVCPQIWEPACRI